MAVTVPPAPSDDSEREADPEITAEEEVPQRVDLGRRFANWRTLASFVFALAILIIALKKSGVTLSDLQDNLRTVNPGLYLLGFIVYYASFPIRTLRWRLLMRNANSGEDAQRLEGVHFRDLLEILYLSWFANCVIPAKLGDVYRAYLLRNTANISASRTVGTILAERVLDMLVLFPLLFVAALLTFRDKMLADSTMRNVLVGGLVLGVLAIVAVLAIWQLGDGLRSLLPQRVHRVFTAFREGALHSFRSGVGVLFLLTLVIWSCEGGRLFLVLASLDLIGSGKLGPSAALFLALGSSVITTIPFAPGGLGLVETFLIAAFKSLMPLSKGGLAAAVALLDRLISYVSLVVIGFILYLFSKKTHAALQAPRPPASSGSGTGSDGMLPDPSLRQHLGTVR